VSYFEICDEESIEQISYGLMPDAISEGKVFFKPGDILNKIYFIVEGEVEIYVRESPNNILGYS
jgi:CRP-like cAMP-binding protein